jgi:D-amino-acid dehydrogenase
MRICVLGAGAIGVTTAYFLTKDGHELTIVDRNGLPGQEASYGNGGQFSYSYIALLASLSALPSADGSGARADRAGRHAEQRVE